jgi:hypothetical protein
MAGAARTPALSDAKPSDVIWRVPVLRKSARAPEFPAVPEPEFPVKYNKKN